MKLDDTNHLKWCFHIKLLLEGHRILEFVDGTKKCPSRFVNDLNVEDIKIDAYQVWKMHDRAIMQLITTTLSSTAMPCIIGSTISNEMWVISSKGSHL